MIQSLNKWGQHTKELLEKKKIRQSWSLGAAFSKQAASSRRERCTFPAHRDRGVSDSPSTLRNILGRPVPFTQNSNPVAAHRDTPGPGIRCCLRGRVSIYICLCVVYDFTWMFMACVLGGGWGCPVFAVTVLLVLLDEWMGVQGAAAPLR